MEIAVQHFDRFRYLLNRQSQTFRDRVYHPPMSDYEGAAAADALIEFEGVIWIQYNGTRVATRYDDSLWVEGDKGDSAPSTSSGD